MSRRVAIAAVLSLAIASGFCGVVAVGPAHPTEPPTPALALAAGLVAVLLARLAWRAGRHEQLHGHLGSLAHPAVLDGVAVRLLAGTRGAFVAGLRRPEIFCAPDLARQLAPDELRAVLYHERYHQQDRAPLRLVALEAIRPFISRFKPGRAWAVRRLAALEIAADRHALQSGSSRSALARALLKLPPQGVTPGVGFASAADLRLAALLDETIEQPRGVPLALILTPAVLVLTCLWAVPPF